MNDLVLVQLDRARLALSDCKNAMEAKQVSDIAEAARVYLERTNASVETVNRAAEIRTLAERQMGAFLKEMPKAQGRRSDLVPNGNQVDPTLSEIGITKKQSSTAQKLASIPTEEFHERVAVLKAGGETPLPSKVLAFDVPAPKPSRFTMPNRGLSIARGAISHLETILPADGERLAALIFVRDWCNRHLNKEDKVMPKSSI
jgi:hypothetical protein